jgi:ribosomal protein S21
MPTDKQVEQICEVLSISDLSLPNGLIFVINIEWNDRLPRSPRRPRNDYIMDTKLSRYAMFRKAVIYLIEIKRKGEEKFDVLLRRFNREVQQSGILTVAKTKRYFEKDQNRSMRRRSAVRRNMIRKLKRGY